MSAASLDVGVVIPTLAGYGGAEIVCLMQCRELLRLGHRVALYTTAAEPRLILECLGTEIEMPVRRLTRIVGTEEYFNRAPLVWSSELDRHDVYFAHQFPLNKLAVQPLVWYAHEPLRARHDLSLEGPVTDARFGGHSLLDAVHEAPGGPRLPTMSDYECELSSVSDSALHRPALCIANSHATARSLRDALGYEGAVVLYPGVDVRTIAPERGESGSPHELRLLFIGTFAFHKRWRLALDVVSRVPGVFLTIAGDGPDQAPIAARALALGLADRVTVVRGPDQAKMEALWATTDIVLACHLREPFGMVPLEAAARGIPSIMTTDSGVAELLESSGLVTAPTVDELVCAVDRLARDSRLRRELGARALQIARAQTWRKHGEQLAARLAHVAPAARRITSPMLTYDISYSDEDPEQFAGYCPLLGRYRSWEGWVIEEHLRDIARLGYQTVILMARVDSLEHVEQDLGVARRVLAIAARLQTGIRFGLGVRQNSRQQLKYIEAFARSYTLLQASYLASANGNKLLYVEDGECTSLPAWQPSQPGTIRLLSAKHHPSVKTVTVHAIQPGSRTQAADICAASQSPILVDGYNCFFRGRFLERVAGVL